MLKTSAQRLRPILLTTITTILGLIPMAMEVNFDFINQRVVEGGITSTWWVQLSTAIISGLAVSTILTLIMIPTMLAMPANFAAAGRLMTGKSYRDWRSVKNAMRTERAGDELADLYAGARNARNSSSATELGALLTVAHAAGAEPRQAVDQTEEPTPNEPIPFREAAE